MSDSLLQILPRLQLCSIPRTSVLPLRKIEVDLIEYLCHILHAEPLIVPESETKKCRKGIEQRTKSDGSKYYRRRIAKILRIVFSKAFEIVIDNLFSVPEGYSWILAI